MAITIGIDPFTTPELEPVAFVHAAAEAGFTHVSLRTVQPAQGSNPGSPAVDERNLEAVLAALSATGLTVAAADIIDVSRDADFVAIEQGLQVAASLGSPSVSIIAKSDDIDSVDEGLGRLCDIALPLGISPRLEPISYLPVGPFDATRDLVLRHPGAGLMIDSLHVHRLNVPMADVRDAGSRLPVTLQINGVASLEARTVAHLAAGGPEPDERRWEALDGRLLPGEGENDVPALVAALPAGIVPIIEAPNSARIARTAPAEYLRAAYEAALAVLTTSA